MKQRKVRKREGTLDCTGRGSNNWKKYEEMNKEEKEEEEEEEKEEEEKHKEEEKEM